MVDYPKILRRGELWYMTYVEYDGSGYVTHLARSPDLLTLYKSNVIWDKEKILGHPFVMYYNAKTESGYERL